MRSPNNMSKMASFLFLCMATACSAVVPLETSNKDLEAKNFDPVENKSKIYVVRPCSYAQKLHDVSLDGGVRISLGCQNYTVFVTNPSEHVFSVFSSENRAMLKIVTKPDEVYFIKMGWKVGSGTGDVKATVSILNTKDGMKTVRESQLISLDGY
ncbi:hypothetical protein P3698_23060 [Vibrio parahaemolyticus]|nr:hypothetical protein [Vibrio parahaemolyticus]MDF5522603.1 hypothetical protein [Vibrio parahaemolyticus]HBC3540504.1 hypothetical protein [Vibrio parahaemolyticus]